MKKIAVLFCVENNVLLSQAQLLIESLNRFFPMAQAYAFAPRANNQPDSSSVQTMRSQGVEVITEVLNTDYLQYPIANKVLACDYFERHIGGHEHVVFVDTDTVFLNPLDVSVCAQPSGIMVRPVDNKGPGSTGPEDPNDAFWQRMYDLFGVSAGGYVTTTVGKQRIRHYFNAGFIWVKNNPLFFQTWKKDFEQLVDSGLRPENYVSREGDDFRCLDQISLAMTIGRFSEQLSILSEAHNHPLPFKPKLDSHLSLSDLVHVHYHRWFQHPDFLDHISTEDDKQSTQYRWLKERLPIGPAIDDAFKC